MLPRIYKVRKKAEIDALAKTGRPYRSVFFIVKNKKNALPETRWIIVVSAKVHKSAVKRNRLRRQVREIIRTSFLKDNLGQDIMVVVKDTALGASFKDLSADLRKTYERVKTKK